MDGAVEDLVVVDDHGDFRYYPSAARMLSDLEYVDEAACILDRAGLNRRLTLNDRRELVCGPLLGTVQFDWLLEAWTHAQHQSLPTHRLLRLLPHTLSELLAVLFEVLALEAGVHAAEAWLISLDGEPEQLPALAEVDRHLHSIRQLDQVSVTDPFGHVYRPVRHRAHHGLPRHGSVLSYVELASIRPRMSPTVSPER
ncbi:hypothetical protein [Psychromicrobium xiongbiense]|uniref:hypothetical protein n=1 Tax=Psychromicrobium xiongbiense TaxID=3051184 RepID=UPI0025552873|nr:hypothetical protein [Psychromicrobium sp. YIM S02556]